MPKEAYPNEDCRENRGIGWTVKIIRQIFPMFSLSLEGIEQSMQYLLRGTPDPLPRLGDIYPELSEFEDLELDY